MDPQTTDPKITLLVRHPWTVRPVEMISEFKVRAEYEAHIREKQCPMGEHAGAMHASPSVTISSCQPLGPSAG